MMDNQGSKKSLLKMVGEGAATFSFVNVVSQIINLISAFIVIHALSVFDYGIWQLTLSLLGLVGALTLPTLENIFLPDMSRDFGKKHLGRYRSQLSSFIRTVFFLNLVVGVLLFVFAPQLAVFVGKDFVLLIRVAALSFFINALVRIYSLIFMSLAKFFYAGSFTLLSRVAYLILVFLLLQFYNLGIYGIAVAYLLASVLPLLIFLPHILRAVFYFGDSPAEPYSFMETFKKHGKWSLLNDQLGFVNNIQPLIIKYFLGVEVIAQFSIALSLYSIIADIVPVGKILTPLFSQEVADHDRFKLLFERGIKYFTWLYVLIGAMAFIATPYFLAIFFPKYLPGLILFNILLLRLLITSLSSVTIAAFYALQAQKNLMFINLMKLFYPFTLSLSIVLFGYVAPAVHDAFFAFVSTFVRYKILKKILPSISFKPASLLTFDAKDRDLLARIVSAIRSLFPARVAN